jgi:hypothetical protein
MGALLGLGGHVSPVILCDAQEEQSLRLRRCRGRRSDQKNNNVALLLFTLEGAPLTTKKGFPLADLND